jgi:hypothetical protein
LICPSFPRIISQLKSKIAMAIREDFDYKWTSQAVSSHSQQPAKN